MNTLAEREIQRSKLVHQVTLYGHLEPGWDGEDSLPPPADAVDAALSFIRLIPSKLPLPVPMLTPSGRYVGFYWDRPTTFIDVEIYQTGAISILVVNKKDTTRDRWIEAATLTDVTPEFFSLHFSGLKEENAHAND
jgi:hypothetical protein